MYFRYLPYKSKPYVYNLLETAPTYINALQPAPQLITPQFNQVLQVVFDSRLNISDITSAFTSFITRNITMTKSLKAVIETLLNQGYTKPQVLETLANEYWIDQSVTRFLASV